MDFDTLAPLQSSVLGTSKLDASVSGGSGRTRPTSNTYRRPEDGRPPQSTATIDTLLNKRSFYFQRRHGKINLAELQSVNIQDVEENVDIETLQHHLEQLTFGDLEASEELREIPEGFLKLFRMSQLTVEYLLNVQDNLADMLDVTSAQCREQEAKLRKARDRVNERDATIRHLKQYVRNKDAAMDWYKSQLPTTMPADDLLGDVDTMPLGAEGSRRSLSRGRRKKKKSSSRRAKEKMMAGEATEGGVGKYSVFVSTDEGRSTLSFHDVTKETTVAAFRERPEFAAYDESYYLTYHGARLSMAGNFGDCRVGSEATLVLLTDTPPVKEAPPVVAGPSDDGDVSAAEKETAMRSNNEVEVLRLQVARLEVEKATALAEAERARAEKEAEAARAAAAAAAAPAPAAPVEEEEEKEEPVVQAPEEEKKEEVVEKPAAEPAERAGKMEDDSEDEEVPPASAEEDAPRRKKSEIRDQQIQDLKDQVADLMTLIKDQMARPAVAAPLQDDETADMRDRLAALEQENADLRQGKDVPPTAAKSPAKSPSRPSTPTSAPAEETKGEAEPAAPAGEPAESPVDKHMVPFSIKLSETTKHKGRHAELMKDIEASIAKAKGIDPSRIEAKVTEEPQDEPDTMVVDVKVNGFNDAEDAKVFAIEAADTEPLDPVEYGEHKPEFVPGKEPLAHSWHAPLAVFKAIHKLKGKVDASKEVPLLEPKGGTDLEKAPVKRLGALHFTKAPAAEGAEEAGSAPVRFVQAAEGELTDAAWLFEVVGEHMGASTSAEDSALACLISFAKGHDQSFAELRGACVLAEGAVVPTDVGTVAEHLGLSSTVFVVEGEPGALKLSDDGPIAGGKPSPGTGAEGHAQLVYYNGEYSLVHSPSLVREELFRLLATQEDSCGMAVPEGYEEGSLQGHVALDRLSLCAEGGKVLYTKDDTAALLGAVFANQLALVVAGGDVMSEEQVSEVSRLYETMGGAAAMVDEENSEAVAAIDATVSARLNLKYESNVDTAGHLAPGAEVALLNTFDRLQSMLDELNNEEEKDDESVRGFEEKLDSCMNDPSIAFLKRQLDEEKHKDDAEFAKRYEAKLAAELAKK
mmetsp:Transcript_5601/g.12897  ORF Transcript_5601/g.12897 Transcript_5601/m.12897 type:complete len:1090 (-) Transcript_5601:173-3442(-)